MSINDIIADRGLPDLLATAITMYGKMGIAGQAMQRCIEYIARFGLNSPNITADCVPQSFFMAIACIATRQVAELLAGHYDSRSLAIDDLADSSMQYWIEKACAALDIDTWLDDSLDKWFFDWQSPLASIIVQACRRKVLNHVVTCAMHGTSLNHDDLVLDIVAELQGKFPILDRFMRHLPRAIDDAIESEVLGIPIIEPAGVTSLNGLVDYSAASSIRGHTNSLF